MAPNHLPNGAPKDHPRNNDASHHSEEDDENTQLLDESEEAKIERLGRQRPEYFHSQWSEILFVFSISISQFLTEYFVSGFPVILPTLIHKLDIPQSQSVWPVTAFSLVIASTLLVFGRIGDMWGGFPVYIGGLVWFITWTIIAGFSVNAIMLDICRALQGFGAAAILPTGIQLMGSTYRPGPRKNLVFALYGTSGILGFFGGIAVAGVVGQYLRWGFYFWIGAIIAGITLVTSIYSISNDRRRQHIFKMDWYGAVTIVSGLVLVVFTITESAHAKAGWREPYIPTLFVVGCLLLCLAVYIEGWVADAPLLPPDVFNIPSMKELTLSLGVLYGTWGIFSVYGTQYFQDIMRASPIRTVAWYTPLGVVGLVLSIFEGLILHLIPGRILLMVSGASAVGAQLLLALLPEDGTYWAWVFPATILATIGIDLFTILMTVFTTTRLPNSRQGLAGGIVNSILQLGVALCLGVADIIESYTEERDGMRQSYKNTFWLGVGLGTVSLVLNTIWGKVPKAKSESPADDAEELES